MKSETIDTIFLILLMLVISGFIGGLISYSATLDDTRKQLRECLLESSTLRELVEACPYRFRWSEDERLVIEYRLEEIEELERQNEEAN